MGDHLWPLLRLKGETEEEKKEAYSKVFVSTYVRDEDGEPIVLTDWNGRRVRFSKHNAEHVLSKDTDYRFRGGHHDKPFDPGRARRILWIKEVLQATAGTIERYGQLRNDTRGRATKRRMLLVVEERYVVILEEDQKGGGDLFFVSAFPADRAYIEREKRKSTFLESKKPQS